MKMYFPRYRSADTVIGSIIESLEAGKEQLKRDNQTLEDDRNRCREITIKLQEVIKILQALDGKLEAHLSGLEQGSDDYLFIQTELLFPLRQRVTDLLQQLNVNQQAVLSFELIIRTNKELIRGVNRALNVTITALGVAVTVALALTRQQLVFKSVKSLNRTTEGLMARNAQMLRQQVSEINQQASAEMIDMNTLKQSCADIRAAIEDVQTFRQNALPQMAQNVLELDALAQEAEKGIDRMERGTNASKPLIDLEEAMSGYYV